MEPRQSSEHRSFPATLPWSTRASSAPHVPGGPSEIIGNLTALLRDIAADPAVDRPFTWPTADQPTTVRNALHPLGTCGLLVREGRSARVILTAEAEHFLATGDELYLLAVLHAHVRFMGEALDCLGDGLNHEMLNHAASHAYGLKWEALDQVRRRVYWLRAAALVDFWSNGTIVPNERGQRFLELLELADPEDLPHRRQRSPHPSELPSAPMLLTTRLEDVDQAHLRSRKRLVGYVAGGTRVASLMRLVNAAVPSITREDFLHFCIAEFGVIESSAEQTLGTLRALGLVTQVGTDTFAATALAASCLASDEPLDFIRLLHLHVALLGETLDALDDEATTSTLLRLLAERYPDVRLTRDDVTRRVALFLETGLAERIGLVVRRTGLGAALVRTLPLLDHPESVAVAVPGPRIAAEDGYSPQTLEAGTNIAAEVDAAALAAEIVQAATDSADYKRFERAVAAAFRAMGIGVEVHSGPKKTDAVLVLWQSPVSRLRVAVEAKTDGAGLVTDDDVKFMRLRKHRELHEAQNTVLVGPQFDTRVVEEAAKDGVALLAAQELADAVVRHSRTPLAPYEIAALVTVREQGAWEHIWKKAERRQEALARVLDTVWRSGNDPVDVEYSAGALSVREIRRETKGVLDSPLDQAEIEEALAFLRTPYVGGVVQRGDDHAVAAPPSLVAARLRAIAAAIDSTSRNTAGRIAMGAPSPSAPERSATPRTPTPRPEGAPSSSLVRAWAQKQGKAVSPRGRLPESLVRAYRSAHGFTDD
ncbi:Lsr2 family DNA-binding protein [Streptomyces globosus]|uniref:Lsr2 family DNA-binding protein n=1 Tax=Streptomyces globosus TaxID=68209 RepID=UPI0031DC5201